MSQKFTAKIYKRGINPCVDIPEEMSRAFGRKGPIPIRGTLNGFPIRATLVPAGGGRHRLYINSGMRTQTGAKSGDRATLRLEPDSLPRIEPTPNALVSAFKRNPKAKAAFQRLPPSHRKEILQYLNSLKREETLERNIAKVVRQLAARQ